MAAFTFSPAAHFPHSLRIFSNCSSPTEFLTIPFCSLPYPSLLFPSKLERLRSPLNHRRPSHAVSALRKISESELVAVSYEAEGLLPSDSGVYAVYDGNGDLQFVGITRDLATSVLAHKNSVPELCVSVKVGVVHDPDKNALTEAWRSWLQEHISSTGKVPPGNEPGNSTWAQNRPPRKKSDLRLTPGPDTRLTVPLESLIDRVVKENKVVAFIKGSRGAPRCGFSQRVVGILESQGVEYESVDVLDEEHNRGLREALKKYSNWPTFPQVFVGGELMGGCDILMAMYEKGELSSLLK